jgi:hypothetical protein
MRDRRETQNKTNPNLRQQERQPSSSPVGEANKAEQEVNNGEKVGGARHPLHRQQARHTQGERRRQGTKANEGDA